MKILLFANSDGYLYNCRLALVQALVQQGHEVTLVSPGGRYAALLEQAGFRWIPFEFSGQGTNPFRELLTLLRLVKLYRAEKPHLVHHFTIKCVLYGSIAAKCTRVASVINTITGLGFVFLEQGLKARICRAIVRKGYSVALHGTHTIFQNNDDLDYFLDQRLVHVDRCFLINCPGVNIEQFKPGPKNRNGPSICVFSAARLLWNNGFQELMEAADIVHQTQGNVIFQIAGNFSPGQPSAIDPTVVEQWCYRKNIQFVGCRNNRVELLQNADIVVLPGYHEEMPLILLEAAACGLPLIATDVPGCREIVRHGINGFLIPVRGREHLAAAILRLAKNQALRRSMGKLSRQIVCREFAERKVLQDTLAVYQQH